MTSIFQDLKYGARMILKNPGIASLAIVALSFGVGLTTITFSLVYGVIIRGLPFEQAEELLHLERANPAAGVESYPVSIHDFVDWRARQASFEDISAFRTGTVNVAGSEARPERYVGAFITPAAFPLLGVQPLLGRTFTEEEDLPGAPPTILIGYSVWQNRFGGDRDIVGRTLRANGETMTIIGVMPEHFEFPVLQQVWLPLRMDPASLDRDGGWGLEVFGRLRDGVSQDQAKAEFATIAAALGQEYPETNEGVGVIIKPYTEEFIGGETAGILYSMLAAVSLVLLIACANVANLLLVRASVRAREIAVRTALGASRGRVIRQMLSEALVLAFVGGLIGTGIASVGISWFARIVATENPPFWFEFSLNAPSLGFIAGASLLAALIAGGIPALQASGTNISEVLKDEGRGSSSLKLGRFARSLVVLELALSVGLLAVSGLMIKGIVKLGNVDMGFATGQVLTARVGLFDADYPGKEDRRQFWNDLLERTANAPGVEAVAMSSILPGQGACCWRFAVAGTDYDRDQDMPFAGGAVVSPEYFDLYRLAATRGRVLDRRDVDGAVPVTVVNESFAARYFPDGEALGKRIRTGNLDSTNPWMTVVGVVPDFWMSDMEEPSQQVEGMYLPLDQNVASFLTINIRTAGDPLSLVPVVRDEVTAIDPNLPIYDVRTMDQVLAQETWFFGFFSVLFSIVGGVALFLASVGLYGVMSFSVANRTQEVGIRMALGARSGSVLRMILKQGLWQIGIGLTLGTGLALAITRGMRQLYFDTEPWDPAIFATILIVLAITGLVATIVPALRATRVDPIEALRYE